MSGSMSISSSTSRVTGLSSGLDVDSLVTAALQLETSKLNKMTQNKQVLQWQQDSYRDIISSLQGFNDSYFDVLKPTSNLRSATAFSAFTSAYGGATSSDYLTATAGASAKAGNYTISNIVTAKAASVTSAGTVTKAMTGSDITGFSISAAADNNKVTVNFNGVAKTITMADNASGDIAALKSDLQTKIDSVFGAGKITVGNSGNKLTMTTDPTNTVSVAKAYNSGLTTVLNTPVTGALTLDNSNNKLSVTLGGTTKNITLTTRAYSDSYDLQNEIQTQINAAFGSSPEKIRVTNQSNVISLEQVDTTSVTATGTLAGGVIAASTVVDGTNNQLTVKVGTNAAQTITLDPNAAGYTRADLVTDIQVKLDAAYGTNKVVASLDAGNNLRFEEFDTTTSLSAVATESGGLSAIGFTANNSNKTNLNTDLFDTKSNFTTALNATGAGNDIQFSINGASFSFNSRTTSINSIMSAVNNNSTANVVMSYDELSDKITISSRQLGATSQVTMSDISGNLLTGALGLSVNKAGVDASMTYDDGSGAKTISRATNSFSINGIAYTLKQDNAGPVNLNITGDTSKIHDTIKGFVDQYNALIDKINTKYTEKKERSYVPLTDEQKSQMKDADITNWETKAKQGLLNGDSLLGNITDSMRSALSDTMYQDSSNSTKLSVTLASIGITTSSDYTQRGKLVIDDDKLNDAISKNPDQIVQLFTKDDSGISYNDGLNDSTKRKQRYDQSGIAVRLYDIIQDNIRTTRDDDGKKGILLEKAGKAGDVSEYVNILTSQMNDYDTRIYDENDLITSKSNALYTKYANLETMLNNMNSQSSWLSAQTSKM